MSTLESRCGLPGCPDATVERAAIRIILKTNPYKSNGGIWHLKLIRLVRNNEYQKGVCAAVP